MAATAGLARVLRALTACSASQTIGGDPAAAAQVIGADGVAVALYLDGIAGEPVWFSPGRSEHFEDVQYTLGQGPSIDAYTSCNLILEPDLGRVRPDRWPALLPAAADLGVGAVFCFPLHLGGACLGTLTAQRASPGPLEPQALDDAVILAAAITKTVLDAGQTWAALGAAPEGVLYRAAIHQATGMVSAQAEVPLEQALLLLRAYAYRHDRLVLEVAEAVVARRIDFRDNHGGSHPPVD